MSCLREVEHLQIPLSEILSATDNFDENNFIALGGYGKVYQGQSEQYGSIAVKRLYLGSQQGQHEFMMEIALLSAYKHENLVSLVGFCDQDGEKILVYKHESNGSLDKYLRSKDLNWIQRLRICLDAANGLKYLHDDVGPQHRVLHRDVKSSNILLDENWKAKISDFGLSKISPANVPFTFLISNACGTIGYIDPEYVNTGVLTKKSDVYSFGVVLFEVLCGRPARVVEYQDEREFLFKLARNHYEKETLEEIIDLDLQKQMKSASLSTFSSTAYRCLKKRREDRPTMRLIVEQLQKALDYQLQPVLVPSGLGVNVRDQDVYDNNGVRSRGILLQQQIEIGRKLRGKKMQEIVKLKRNRSGFDTILHQQTETEEKMQGIVRFLTRRLVHEMAVIYLVALTVLLFQNRDDARLFMKYLHPDLGIELPERSYGIDCRIYVPENPTSRFINVYETLFDELIPARFFGWWGKAIIIRNQPLLWVLSIGFELIELTFRHMLPNFNECWWHIILDILICNWFGIWAGMRTVRYFDGKTYEWVGISRRPNVLGKVKRTLGQFTPAHWEKDEWHPFLGPWRFIQVLSLCIVLLTVELNTFFLQFCLWVPPRNPIIIFRWVLWWLIAFPTIREYNSYLQDRKPVIRVGAFCWLSLAICIIELLICIKFGHGLFPTPMPRWLVILWTSAGVGLSVFLILWTWQSHRTLSRKRI